MSNKTANNVFDPLIKRQIMSNNDVIKWQIMSEIGVIKRQIMSEKKA